MIHIEPLGTRVVLPAFVIGFEIDGTTAWQATEDGTSDQFPAWFLALDQQAGGYAMWYPTVVGVVLRFSDNGAHCLRDVNAVVRGFAAMAEDPNFRVLRSEFPVLASLAGTRGDEYAPAELQRLYAFVSRFFRAPRFESGTEAFIRCELCDPMDFFADWRMLHAVAKPGARQIYTNSKPMYFEEGNMSDLTLSCEATFQAAIVTQLMEAGKCLGAQELRVFFLWENSD